RRPGRRRRRGAGLLAVPRRAVARRADRFHRLSVLECPCCCAALLIGCHARDAQHEGTAMKHKRFVLPALLFVIAACIPDDTSKPGWGLFPGAVGSNDTGSSPGVLVVGDSLTFNLDVQQLANAIRFFRGTDAVVAAAGGASMAHFNKPTLIGAAGL